MNWNFSQSQLFEAIRAKGADQACSDLDIAMLIAIYLERHTSLPTNGTMITAGMVMLADRSVSVERGEGLFRQLIEHGLISSDNETDQ